MSAVKLFDFQAFECTGCGRCCKPWEVSIDPEQRRLIEASAIYAAKARPGFLPLRFEDDGVAMLGERGDNACVFLAEDNLCLVHAEIGGRNKPLGCQLYPYLPVRTPDGIYAHLSFACPPVVAGLDQNVERNRQDLEQAVAYRQAQAPELTSFSVCLHDDLEISWESYLALEGRILESYRPDQPLDSLLRLILGLFRVLADGVPEQWPELTPILEDTEFPVELLRKYLGSLVASNERLEGDEHDALARAVEQGEGVRLERMGLDMPALSTEPPAQTWIQGTFLRYIGNAVLGKALLSPSVLHRLLALACAIPLTQYYAEGYRAARGLSEIDLACLTDAFRVVDGELITHTHATAPYFDGLRSTFQRLSEFPLLPAPVRAPVEGERPG